MNDDIGRLDIEEVLERVTTEKGFFRLAAIFELQRFGGEAKIAIPVLISILQEEDRFAVVAAQTLGRIGSAAIPSLRDGVKGQNVGVREHSIRALQEIGSDQALSIAKEALSDPHTGVRARAVAAWSKADDPEAPRILRELVRTDPEIRVRIQAAKAILSRIDACDPVAQQLLWDAIGANDPLVRLSSLQVAIRVLPSIRVVERLRQCVTDDDLRVRVLSCLGLIFMGDSDTGGSVLGKLLGNPNTRAEVAGFMSGYINLCSIRAPRCPVKVV